MKERRKEAGTVVLFLSKVSLAKNKASLGRQYTGEMGSYWTVIDCTLGKSGSLALCQCKHPQISARQNSIFPTLAKKCCFWVVFFRTADRWRTKQLKKHKGWIAETKQSKHCVLAKKRFSSTNPLCCQGNKKKTERKKKATVHLILLPPVFYAQKLFKR